VVQAWQEPVETNTNILPITSLSHVTHNREAIEIRKNDEKLVFKPKAKVGKAIDKYDGSPVGKTFKPTGYRNPLTKQDMFTRILPDQPVFPGQISWWGISSNWAQTDCGATFRTTLDNSIKYTSLFEANYLKCVPHSRYGNKEFICSFQYLMTYYKQSRNDCVNKKVVLKRAGTLRYRYEICYVIMAAMEGDVDGTYPSMFVEPRFKHNNLIDENGKLISCSTPPGFQINHPFSGYHDLVTNSWVNYSWETLAFGFYFPDNFQMALELPRHLCREEGIPHSTRICTSKQPTGGYGSPWVCPNDLPQPQ